MARIRHQLTEEKVAALEPGEIIWDRKISGFGARCQGKRTKFFVQFRLKGRLRWFTIERSVSKSPSISCGAKTAVGSSMMSTSAPR